MIEFGAGGAIMHAEEPAANTEPQQAAAGPPAADGSVPPAAATRSAEGDNPAPAVPEIVIASADGSTAGPPEMATQPATNDDPVATSVPPQAGSAPPVTPTPVDLPTAVVPQNPRRKRRAKGWSCPVCRQRKCPRISISHSFTLNLFFDPLTETSPHLHQLTHPCCGLRLLRPWWTVERKESASRPRLSTTR
jgi:hypothetical protein